MFAFSRSRDVDLAGKERDGKWRPGKCHHGVHLLYRLYKDPKDLELHILIQVTLRCFSILRDYEARFATAPVLELLSFKFSVASELCL